MAPLNPESLMWAHQLKREHGHLLKKTQNLESAQSKLEDRMKATENAAKANANGDAAAVKELAEQVRAIDSNGIKDRLDGMEKEVNRKLDDVEAENEAMTMQIATLQQDKQLAEEERKANLTKDKALLKRIGEVEAGLKKYEQALDLVGKRVDGTQIEQINEQLKGLTKIALKEGEKMTLLTESVQALEVANGELVKANAKLEKELREKNAKASVERNQDREEATESITQTNKPTKSTSPVTKKKSHKWAGGGADKDIILQGSNPFGISSAPKLTGLKGPTKATKKPDPPEPSIQKRPVDSKKKKIAIPRTPIAGSDRKSHKWAGGGADRAVIQAGLSLDTKSGGNQPSGSTAAVPRESPHTQAQKWAGEKEVVRAGRGWYEVAVSPTPETESRALSVKVKENRGRPKKPPAPLNEDGTAMKRPRGRPRKYPRSEETQTRDTSSNIQVERSTSETKKRTAGSAFEDPSPDPLGPSSKRWKGSPDAEERQATQKKEPGVFSSPVSSPPQIHVAGTPAANRGSTEAAVGGAVPPSGEVAPKPQRRQIVQINNDISTIVRHMSG